MLKDVPGLTFDGPVMAKCVAAAADTATQLAQAAVDPANDFYNAACYLARCILLAERDPQLSAAQRKQQAETYAARFARARISAIAKPFV